MKTKNAIIGSGVVLGGVALYFIFFRKNKKSYDNRLNVSVNTGNASTGLLPVGSGGISKVGGDVRGNLGVIIKDTNKEEFDLLYKTFREFKALLVKEQRKLSDLNNDVGVSRFVSPSLREAIKKAKLKKQQKIVDDIESDLNDYEQRILDLGYSATSRGTFYKR
ncbi:MAG: hypothetical protein P1U29_03820 [Candidatus Pelagibacter bacterium]|jgi:hypothetical protein|nr:hypothetical protein [Vicingaceae bacterium]MDF1858078.1 hypothetical protein [Candidatus Pelagibacter bacterium]